MQLKLTRKISLHVQNEVSDNNFNNNKENKCSVKINEDLVILAYKSS